MHELKQLASSPYLWIGTILFALGVIALEQIAMDTDSMNYYGRP